MRRWSEASGARSLGRSESSASAWAITDASVLRTELARVRRQGWAELVDELEDGLASISVPLHSPRGSLVGIVGISGPTFRLGRIRRRDLLPTVQATAREIECGLAR